MFLVVLALLFFCYLVPLRYLILVLCIVLRE